MPPRKTIIGKPINDELYTPQFVLDWLPPVDLDPCWSPDSLVRPLYYYDKDSDGLANPWGLPGVQVVFVNMPYSNLGAWLMKCASEYRLNPHLVIICLVQSKPSENSWHKHVWPDDASTGYVGFLRGRLKHGTPPGVKSVSGTFGSALIFFGNEEKVLPIVADAARLAKGHKHEPVWTQKIHL